MHLRTTEIRKTRKEHICLGCLKKFKKGSWLWYQVGIFDGFYAYHFCNPCKNEMMSGDYSDGFTGGDIKESRRCRVKEYLNVRRRRNCSTMTQLLRSF